MCTIDNSVILIGPSDQLSENLTSLHFSSTQFIVGLLKGKSQWVTKVSAWSYKQQDEQNNCFVQWLYGKSITGTWLLDHNTTNYGLGFVPLCLPWIGALSR